MPFFAGTKKDYFRLYASTAKAIKKVDSQLKVGGPSTSGSKWVGDFLDFCRKNSIPVDFVTTHQYAGDALGGIDDKEEKTKININPFAAMGKNRPDTVLGAFRKLMMTDRVYENLKKDNLIKSSENAKRQAGHLPLFYTEWNLCASFSAPCNDTRMVASYDVHSILNTEKNIDGSSIWCFTDLFEELHPFPEEFHGGFGMMTQGGIKKPLFYALKYLGNMPDTRIVLPERDDEITAAAFRGENSLDIAVTMCVTDNSPKSRSVSFSLDGFPVPVAAYITRIDENSGNPLKEWEKLGSPVIPTREQCTEINRNSRPLKKELPFRAENGTVFTDISINSNDVLFLHFDM